MATIQDGAGGPVASVIVASGAASGSNNAAVVTIAPNSAALGVTFSGTSTVQDVADGSSTGGTAGTKSQLAGLIHNTSAPTLSNGQQAGMQADVSGNLLVNLQTALPAGGNTIGVVNQGTSPWIVAGAGTAGTPGTAVLTVQGIGGGTALPASQSGTWTVAQGTAAAATAPWPMEVTDGTHGVAATKASSTAAATTDISLVVALSPNSALFDGNGNPVEVKNRVSMPATQGVTPVSGLDAGLVNRTMRVGPHGTLRTASETLEWHDAIETTNVNAFLTQSATTMTIAQTTGVLTLNNSGITTVNTDAIITTQRQFAKLPKAVLHWHMRANISANVAANHTLVEMGLGAPAGVTAIVSTGAFFRWTVAGVLNGVISFNGTEQSTQLLAQGTINTSNYYRYDIFVEDEFVRFIVTDSNDVPVVDTQIQLTLSVANMFSVSHLPSFARVYTDATGGGTAIKLNISASAVYLLDVLTNKSWQQQMAALMRNATINPTTGAQTPSTMIAAPATVTPSNTAAAYTTLGGDYAVALTVASENPVSVFAFTVPSPYTFYLTEIQFSLPFVTTTIGVTGVPIIEWIGIANCASANISTGGGQRFPLGFNMLYTGATQAAGTFLTSGGNFVWNPDVPIACLPGTVLHIAYKVFIITVATTPGVTRGSVYVDGYFE